MGILKYKESAPKAYYHLYNRGNQKNLIFKEDYDYRLYLNRLQKACKKNKFSIISYCLMPNHIHLIVKQNSDFSPSKLVSSIHTSYSMMFNQKYDTVGHLFQDRYKQKIIGDDEYMLCLIAYIHFNPVKDGICKLPKQYLWSSYREYVGLSKFNICDKTLIESYNLKGQSFKNFISLVNKINPADVFD